MNPTVRSAEGYYIAETMAPCWKCDRETQVIGVILPAGHEVCDVDLEDALWEEEPFEAAVYYLAEVAAAPLLQLTRRSPGFRLSGAQGVESYWANHCTHCAVVQGDFHVFQQPEGPLHPMEEEAATRISLTWMSGPFEADSGGISYGGVHLFERMRRK